jgi:predicted HicB family RNase H-like nuclease
MCPLQFGPISDEEAKAWLEQHANHLVEEHFGPAPEGGSAERRLTIRIPVNLFVRLEAAAAEAGVSLNNYAMRCFERCARESGRPAPLR